MYGGLAALALAALALAPSGAGGDAEADADAGAKGETIRANVVAMGGAAGRKTGYFTAWVDRYTPDDELARWVEAFRAGGQHNLVAVWQRENPVVGRARFLETLGRDLRVARSRPTENGGRRIILVTDRPLTGAEGMTDTHSEDYPLGWVEIEVDEKGRGEGKLIAAAKLTLDEQGELSVESYSIAPMQLFKVKIKVGD
jgi:hypothetical protein